MLFKLHAFDVTNKFKVILKYVIVKIFKLMIKKQNGNIFLKLNYQKHA